MQQDFHRQWQAARRALRARRLAMFLPAGLGALGAIVLFALTVGPLILTGAPWPFVVTVLPPLEGGMAPAFALFVLGLMVLLFVIYLVTALGRSARLLRG